MTKWADKVEERLEIVGRGKRRRPEDYPARTRMEDDRTRQSVNRASRRRVIVHFSDDAGAAAAAQAASQPLNAKLTALGGLAVTDGNFAVGDGATWVAESGATVRTSLGLGDSATKNVGTGAGDVAAGNHAHSGVYEPAFGTAAWTISNDITDRTFDPSSTTLQEIGNALATLIRDFAAANKPSV